MSGPALRQLSLSAVAFITPLAILSVLSPSLTVSPFISFALGFSAAALSISLCTALSPSPWLCALRPAAFTVLSGLVLVFLSLVLPPRLGALSGSLGLALVSLCLGAIVGHRVESLGHLPAVALISSATDLWSVTSPSGVTHAVTRNPALLRLLTVNVVPPGETLPHPVIGFADIAFAALYLAVVTRFGVRPHRAGALVFIGLVSAGAAAMALERPVPALPFLGAAVVFGLPKTWQIDKRDRVATAVTAALFVVSLARALTR